MKHELDLSKYPLRTDLLIDDFSNINEDIIDVEEKEIGNIKVNITKIKQENEIRKKGTYTTISFEDITDHQNYNELKKVLEEELKNIIKDIELKDNYKVLVIGLGNRNSTPDSLGVKVSENIIVTRHLAELNEMSNKYRIVASFSPNVMGNTGIEAQSIIKGLIKEIEIDLVIVIDALASSKIERVNKTIQLTNTGIHPGSGVGNHRKELSKDTLNIPVIALGVPTVVDATTIVTDTINLLIKKIEYMKNNESKEKLKAKNKVNYLKEKRVELDTQERNKLLGLIGELSDEDLKSFISEVLTPIGYNMMVTPKEIDFIIDKLVMLISQSLNNALHNIN